MSLYPGNILAQIVTDCVTANWNTHMKEAFKHTVEIKYEEMICKVTVLAFNFNRILLFSFIILEG